MQEPTEATERKWKFWRTVKPPKFWRPTGKNREKPDIDPLDVIVLYLQAFFFFIVFPGIPS